MIMENVGPETIPKLSFPIFCLVNVLPRSLTNIVILLRIDSSPRMTACLKTTKKKNEPNFTCLIISNQITFQYDRKKKTDGEREGEIEREIGRKRESEKEMGREM